MTRGEQFNKFMAELPSTSLRISVSIVLAVFFVLVTMIGIVSGKVDNGTIESLDTVSHFILFMMLADVAQFAAKRFSYDKDPPPTPDREDAPALEST